MFCWVSPPNFKRDLIKVEINMEKKFGDPTKTKFERSVQNKINSRDPPNRGRPNNNKISRLK